MQPVCAACCGGGRWCVCVCVYVVMCLDLCLYIMFWSSQSPAPSPKQTSQALRSRLPRMQDGSDVIMVSLSKEKEGTLRRLSAPSSPIPPSLSSVSTLFITFILRFIILSHRTMLPLNSPTYRALARSHSPVALFPLCGKCQVGRWCYLHENWRTKATGNFSHLLPGLIFRRTAEDGRQRQSPHIFLVDFKPSVVHVHYLNPLSQACCSGFIFPFNWNENVMKREAHSGRRNTRSLKNCPLHQTHTWGCLWV